LIDEADVAVNEPVLPTSALAVSGGVITVTGRPDQGGVPHPHDGHTPKSAAVKTGEEILTGVLDEGGVPHPHDGHTPGYVGAITVIGLPDQGSVPHPQDGHTPASVTSGPGAESAEEAGNPVAPTPTSKKQKKYLASCCNRIRTPYLFRCLG